MKRCKLDPTAMGCNKRGKCLFRKEGEPPNKKKGDPLGCGFMVYERGS
jgi:hypothetical protein